jgi:lysozyme
MTTYSDFQLATAAQWSKGLPHQVEAWNWLQSQLNSSTLEEFKQRYRNEYRIINIPVQHKIPLSALEIIKHFEGLSLTPYICSAGVPTIGLGTTVYPDGQRVKLSDSPITEQQAQEYLELEINKRIVPRLSETVPYWNSMTNNQRAALISFAYNLGENFMVVKSGFTTIQQQLKTKNWDSIPETLKLYRNPGTASEPGLLRRRQEEGLLWQSKGIYAE